MLMPRRIQRQRTKGWRMPPGCRYVGRPTIFGNPYTLDCLIPEKAVALFRAFLTDGKGGLDAQRIIDRLPELRGRDLCCWCPLTFPGGRPYPCHADVLLELANR